LIDRIVLGAHLMGQAREIAADALAVNPDVLKRIKAMCAGR
jgi:hypothetical protein